MKNKLDKEIIREEAKKAWEDACKQAAGNEDMTLDEINEEIRLAREEIRKEEEKNKARV